MNRNLQSQSGYRENKMVMFATTVTSSSYLHFPKRLLITRQTTIKCSSTTSSISASFDLKTYWSTLREEINQKLDEAIPVKYPAQIYESMRYSVLAEGAKRAPPVMCVAACELLGGNRLAAFPTACALEMVHAASLIHDDLPCMDDDPSRRGQPSNHTVFEMDMAILTADALFPLGFRHIARAVGSTGMAAGQFVDLEGPANAIDFIHEKKYGEMGECSAVCGGLLAGANDEEIQRLRTYGRAVGILYQVVDDLLEAKSSKNKLVAAEKLVKENNKSYVGAYGVEEAMEVAEALRAEAKTALEGFEKYGEKVLPLYSFVDYAADRSFSFADHV
ncbi:putative transferase [Helianthus annuus]|uniref:Putative polyprenyl synthetase-related protein n=1 Tax=Helianthus annuus TaxID=4232 RepID=A0A251U507_HELAN|nr:heterodimeric geranylgeranyl pyrophosphate synthase small subunit, chloroplastic [Helianthus annuus]KAF5793889.1 putative transferase [Helianthus annuus]KAJ0537622.1 putative transferase [Helianthus annuus]KAJ0552203.1 putative transferase [Helianthus annuus]KAJ0717904.1 putative transferase [Helianthus annuus]KAJ0721140.1 putative transferase [Helianthus annuus]